MGKSKHREENSADLDDPPTIFGNQLAKELEDWRNQNPTGALLQYVDDILIATEAKQQCWDQTVALLNFLGLNGYRVSKNKAQVVQTTVTYLGFKILQGQRRLGQEWKEAICQLPQPQTLNRALMQAPALGLPDQICPFELFTYERQNVALGVLSQFLSDQRRAMVYFSKQLDNVSQGWPSCLRAVAATVLLIQEAQKLTSGQSIVVYVPHVVQSVHEQRGGHWLSPSRRLKYQVVLLKQDDITLKATFIVNPATFLSVQQVEGTPEHDCLQTIEEVYSSRPDLGDSPLENPDWELFTDGSSFVQNGKRLSGYAVLEWTRKITMIVVIGGNHILKEQTEKQHYLVSETETVNDLHILRSPKDFCKLKKISCSPNKAYPSLNMPSDQHKSKTQSHIVKKITSAKSRKEALILARRELKDMFPLEDPKWDPDLPEKKEALKRYHDWVVYGLRHAIQKAVKWSKTYQVKQDKNESPTDFLNRLKEAIRKYTDVDINSDLGKKHLVYLFISQSADDIRKKLQKAGEKKNIECESKYKTTILLVKKADGKSYRLVQDLRAINKITEDIHPVANPYTLLTTLPDDLGPDLKDVPLENPDWAMPVDVSSQKAELIALTRVLELSEGKKPGDWVYVKWWDSDPLRAKWRGPFQVLLTSLTTVIIIIMARLRKRRFEKGSTHACYTVKVAGKGPGFVIPELRKLLFLEQLANQSLTPMKRMWLRLFLLYILSVQSETIGHGKLLCGVPHNRSLKLLKERDITAWVENMTLKVYHVDAHMPKGHATEEYQNNEQVDKAAKIGIAQLGRGVIEQLGGHLASSQGQPTTKWYLQKNNSGTPTTEKTRMKKEQRDTAGIHRVVLSFA
ncbi:hypothetical protein BTVI_148866 [Pitangus sulphuratus]|nr:hypothetical protein BTVI_148866 [Pitangus sulphuratus]